MERTGKMNEQEIHAGAAMTSLYQQLKQAEANGKRELKARQAAEDRVSTTITPDHHIVIQKVVDIAIDPLLQTKIVAAAHNMCRQYPLYIGNDLVLLGCLDSLHFTTCVEAIRGAISRYYNGDIAGGPFRIDYNDPYHDGGHTERGHQGRFTLRWC